MNKSTGRTAKQLANDQRLREMGAARRGVVNAHETRAQGQRGTAVVHDTESTPWVQGGSLVAPKPRPGYVQRWIRMGVKGKDDAVNISRKFREGWQPRAADTVPSSYQTAKIGHGRFAGFIGVEGMLLCELPVKNNDQRKRFIREQTDKKVKAIDADLQRANKANQGPGFGEIQKSSRTIPVREVRVQQEEGAKAD